MSRNDNAPVKLKIDGRTREARLIRQFRRKLIEQLGGSATIDQQKLIDEMAMLELRRVALDQRFIDGECLSHETASAVYCAVTNRLRRSQRELGLGEPEAAQTILWPGND